MTSAAVLPPHLCMCLLYAQWWFQPENNAFKEKNTGLCDGISNGAWRSSVSPDCKESPENRMLNISSLLWIPSLTEPRIKQAWPISRNPLIKEKWGLFVSVSEVAVLHSCKHKFLTSSFLPRGCDLSSLNDTQVLVKICSLFTGLQMCKQLLNGTRLLNKSI